MIRRLFGYYDLFRIALKTKEAEEENRLREDHPVWAVYDMLRLPKLNADYYKEKLDRTRRKNTWVEFILAGTVPSSAIAALPIWKAGYGVYIWGTLLAVASVFAVAKPFWNFSGTIQAYEASAARYRTVYIALSELRNQIRQRKSYDARMEDQFMYIYRTMSMAQEFEPTDPIDEALQNRIYLRIVNQELPKDTFYVPGDENRGSRNA